MMEVSNASRESLAGPKFPKGPKGPKKQANAAAGRKDSAPADGEKRKTLTGPLVSKIFAIEAEINDIRTAINGLQDEKVCAC